MFSSLIFFLILCGLSVIEAAKILAIIPTPSVSHQVVFRVLTQELVKRGHEVVVITTDPAFPNGQAPANLTEIDVHDVSYTFFRKLLTNQDFAFEIGRISSWTKQLKTIQELDRVMEVQINYQPVQELIKAKKNFDLLLIEAFIPSTIAFSYIFKAPVIQVSSFGALQRNLETIGASTHPTLYPIPFRQRLYNLSLWEKIKEYFYHVQHLYYNKMHLEVTDKMLQGIFGSHMPSINDLLNNVDMLFLNVHPIWMDNQPMPPNVIFMGGLHQKPAKKLPQDLQLYLDSSKNGVVYVSFGTNVHPFLFPPERLNVLVETLSELPYDVLLKWNNDELPGKTENIKISKWLPQSDLLRHPNVKAFVMQGGLQSTDEAMTAGVPLVCIPMLGDQWYNAEKYVKLNIGYNIDFMTFTKTQLKDAIEDVIKDTSYRENIVKLRERMNDQPQTPLERAVWWTEYVIRHGGARHLRSPAANMPWVEYYELQLVAVVLIGFFAVVIVSAYLLVLLWNFLNRFATSNIKSKTS